MTQSLKRLDAMRRNPSGNWTIADIERLCEAYGVEFLRSRAGSSQYKVKHLAAAEILTIPFAQPIKAV